MPGRLWWCAGRRSSIRRTMTADSVDGFSPHYAAAHQRFLRAVSARGGTLHGERHPLAGPFGEALWQDVARFGDPRASRVFIVTCGTHGIEGHAGSAVMSAWLEDGGPGSLPPDASVVLVHAVNPWGM